MTKGLEIDLSESVMIQSHIKDNQYAHELYVAMCNIEWWHEEINGPTTMSWRQAAGMIADLRGKGEDYLDFYCGGACKNINLYGRDPTEGTVTERIRIDLLTLGWSWSDDIFNQEQEEDKECVLN